MRKRKKESNMNLDFDFIGHLGKAMKQLSKNGMNKVRGEKNQEI